MKKLLKFYLFMLTVIAGYAQYQHTAPNGLGGYNTTISTGSPIPSVPNLGGSYNVYVTATYTPIQPLPVLPTTTVPNYNGGYSAYNPTTGTNIEIQPTTSGSYNVYNTTTGFGSQVVPIGNGNYIMFNPVDNSSVIIAPNH